MATFSIRPLLLAIVLVGAALPTQAMAGPATTAATAPAEMWDVITPRAEHTPVVSHIDVVPSQGFQGQGFDAPGMTIPMEILIVTRAEFEGSVHATEMWDAVADGTPPKAVGVSHMDIQPGQSFDYPTTYAPHTRATVKSASIQTRTTPDA